MEEGRKKCCRASNNHTQGATSPKKRIMRVPLRCMYVKDRLHTTQRIHKPQSVGLHSLQLTPTDLETYRSISTVEKGIPFNR
eukprot:1161710-Pelagomonas_calceolata.AAC.4